MIKYSGNDIRRGITIPSKLDSELAEIVGIIIGDGHVGFDKG